MGCYIGLPYDTKNWQVEGSSERNGHFKMALTKAKQELVGQKNDACLEFANAKIGIVGLLHKTWKANSAK